MSNFLQRVASMAAPAQNLARPRLQPMLGSIFAPVVPLVSAATGPADSWETNAETEPGRAKIEMDLGNSDRLLTSTRGSGSSPASAMPVSRLTPLSEPPLLRGDYGGDTSNHARLGGTEQHEKSIVSRQSEKSRGEESARGSETRPFEAADSSPSSRAGQTRPQQNLTPIPMQAVRATAPPRIDAVRRASAQRSEPDEIHIHIGRIEVAAVAPQPQRVAAPAPRKGLNLDEYLRRGSGGQR
jgi:hypothetical protein